MNRLDVLADFASEIRQTYSDNGYAILREFIMQDELSQVRDEIRRLTRSLDRNTTAPAERDTYGRAFTQVFNLWRRSSVAQQLVFSKRLASAAASLMGVDAVRIYHDQALFKEIGGGHTPWHCDQFYWPIDTDKTITAWIPLQDTSLDMGPLAFAAGSHTMTSGRELQISDESERVLSEALAEFELDEAAFAMGDVSFHSGWCFHRAGPNLSQRTREAFTVIYLDAEAVLRAPQNPFEEFDAKKWCPGVRPGEQIASELNPIVFESAALSSP